MDSWKLDLQDWKLMKSEKLFEMHLQSVKKIFINCI